MTPQGPAGAAREIVVRGTGRQEGAPDVALLSLGVETRASRATSALDANRTAAAAVLTALFELAVEARDVRTEHIGIHLEHDHRSGQALDYVAVNRLTVRLRDLDASGTVLDAVAGVAGDAIRIHGLGFDLADRHQLERVARAAAVDDAFEQAEQLAVAAGVQRGPVLSIRPAAGSDGLGRGGLTSRVASMESMPVEGGTVVVTVEVDVVFAIE